MPSHCPPRDRLLAYVLGNLSEPEIQSVASHVDTCQACEAALPSVDETADDLLVSQLRGPLPESCFSDDPQYQAALARVQTAGVCAPAQNTVADYRCSPATLFGEYYLLAKLGQGGMGAVYKARRRGRRRLVALKILSRATMQSPDAVQRFHREVQAAARLSHPNIVAVHDSGAHDGVHFLAMEYVDGRDLAAIVKRRGPLSYRKAVQVILQAACALQYAHAQGVVHRDVKPANLVLNRQGTIKLLDMGLAHLEPAQVDGQSLEQRLARPGQILGTFEYMPPEQAADPHTVDTRSDIYSLGCTLFYLLTGKSPYEHSSALKVILAHRDAPVPSLAPWRPDAPVELEAILARMLAKRPPTAARTWPKSSNDSSSSWRTATTNPPQAALLAADSPYGPARGAADSCCWPRSWRRSLSWDCSSLPAANRLPRPPRPQPKLR